MSYEMSFFLFTYKELYRAFGPGRRLRLGVEVWGLTSYLLVLFIITLYVIGYIVKNHLWIAVELSFLCSVTVSLALLVFFVVNLFKFRCFLFLFCDGKRNEWKMSNMNQQKLFQISKPRTENLSQTPKKWKVWMIRVGADME